MARAMFEYTKEILTKVSFDVSLFCKEVQKAINRLLPYELEELKLFIVFLSKQNPHLIASLTYLK
ncbi:MULTISPECIES: hypothetical protein [Mesonia]|jgi:hypothetical protein|uniref:Uncharacterized protein n=1 Tax=Mesonia mobilis TaxID=369791 RepID=A0ABQ3BSB1_9FLAO|nr:hypothetical protein [Mesonia mobilis]MBQ0737163.1 hypothetical protein [Aquimarina celericrescens]GGZ51665.1 hypothetical protein GCM10008088_11920 [Mesonia mobilis]|tara:strand:+ start:933 stop:1127 length:195 start_codon:yes stop_codon:yes gene_type:complete